MVFRVNSLTLEYSYKHSSASEVTPYIKDTATHVYTILEHTPGASFTNMD